MAANSYTRVSPGLYRSPTGQLVRQGRIPKQPNPAQPPEASTPATTAPTYRSNFKQAGKGFYRNNDGKLVSGGLMDTMTKRFNRYASDFSGLKQEDPRYNTLGQSLRDIGTKYGFDTGKVLGANWQPYQAPAPTTPPASDPAASPAAEAPPQAPPSIAEGIAAMQSYQSPMTKSLLSAMKAGTNTMAAYEPKNFEGSPLYQFQKQKGLSDLEKLMSARGLTGSGAEVQANSNFLADLNSTEAEKQRQFAEQEANRNQSMMQFVANYDMGDREALRNQLNTDLDRRIGQQQFEANRGDSRNALMTNFLQNILQMQSDNNVAQMGMQGLGQQSQYMQALMNAMAQNAANSYRRYSGGGGGGTPPQAPMGPELDIMRIMAQFGNRAGNNDVFNQISRMITGS